MLVRLLLTITLLLTLSGCQKDEPPPSAAPAANTTESLAPRPATPAALPPGEPLKAQAFLASPLAATIIETTNEALPLWRKFAKNRPLLAIVSQGPALAPIPEEVAGQATRLLRDGSDAELKTRTGMNIPDPLLIPPMSATAALDAGWLAGVVWIFPTTAHPEQIDPELFKQQITEAGFVTPQEAQALAFERGVFRGTVRGKSFIAAPLAALPRLEQPVVLHIDSDYFKPLYKGEIKTPLHDLLFTVLSSIKEQGWKVAAATVAHSNLGAELPLQTRFLGSEIADILHDPGLLAGDLPPLWQARADALYLENFMQKDKQLEIYTKLEKEEPADPSIKFALYHVFRLYQDKGDMALRYLDQAARIDPIYALEYLALADVALQKKRPGKAVEMMQLARAARPEDPFVLLKAARTMLNAGAPEKAKALLPELTALQWSNLYYPQLVQETEGLIGLLKQ